MQHYDKINAKSNAVETILNMQLIAWRKEFFGEQR